ncbi:MAG: ABC transporter substrate-binding protein [Deltaproteobacteria bacterium]|nr:ABC transporter substrate-binding protein [Deltaproteobacteria bacterium]
MKRHWYGWCVLVILLIWAEMLPAAPLKIGEIDPLTGRFAKQGREIHQGIAVAVAEVNEAGGIKGQLITLLTRDDQSRPDVAISMAEDLCANQKIVGLTGGYVDALVGPISEVASKYGVPYVASASLQKELVQRGNPYFFRVATLSGFVAPLCDFFAKELKPQRLAILHASTPGSTELAMDLEQCLKRRHLPVSMVEKFRPGTPDFTPLIGKLMNMKVEIIFSGGFSHDHMLMVRQLKENGFTPKAYVGPFGIAYESFIEEMGPEAEFLFTTCAWNPGIYQKGTAARSAEFRKRFRRMFGREPNTTNMHGYTSTMALLAALHKVLARGLPASGPHVRQALAKLDILLPMERLAFDSRGDPRFYRHVIVQVQHGKLVVVYPPAKATGTAIYPMPPWNRRK